MAPPPGRGGASRKRLILVLVAGIVGLLCLGGASVFFVLYDQETRIDRQDPDQVVSSFLRATLVNEDPNAAKLLTCDSPDLAQIEALQAEIKRRESDFDVTVAVSWGTLHRSKIGDAEEQVTTELNISGQAHGQTRSRRSEQWRFRAVDEDGWRVCGTTKVS